VKLTYWVRLTKWIEKIVLKIHCWWSSVDYNYGRRNRRVGYIYIYTLSDSQSESGQVPDSYCLWQCSRCWRRTCSGVKGYVGQLLVSRHIKSFIPVCELWIWARPDFCSSDGIFYRCIAYYNLYGNKFSKITINKLLHLFCGVYFPVQNDKKMCRELTYTKNEVKCQSDLCQNCFKSLSYNACSADNDHHRRGWQTNEISLIRTDFMALGDVDSVQSQNLSDIAVERLLYKYNSFQLLNLLNSSLCMYMYIDVKKRTLRVKKDQRYCSFVTLANVGRVSKFFHLWI